MNNIFNTYSNKCSRFSFNNNNNINNTINTINNDNTSYYNFLNNEDNDCNDDEVYNEFTGEMHLVSQFSNKKAKENILMFNKRINEFSSSSNKSNNILSYLENNSLVSNNIYSSSITPVKAKYDYSNYYYQNKDIISVNLKCNICTKDIEEREMIAYCSCYNNIHYNCLNKILLTKVNDKTKKTCYNCNCDYNYKFLNNIASNTIEYNDNSTKYSNNCNITSTNINNIDSINIDILLNDIKDMKINEYENFMVQLNSNILTRSSNEYNSNIECKEEKQEYTVNLLNSNNNNNKLISNNKVKTFYINSNKITNIKSENVAKNSTNHGSSNRILTKFKFDSITNNIFIKSNENTNNKMPLNEITKDSLSPYYEKKYLNFTNKNNKENFPLNNSNVLQASNKAVINTEYINNNVKRYNKLINENETIYKINNSNCNFNKLNNINSLIKQNYTQNKELVSTINTPDTALNNIKQQLIFNNSEIVNKLDYNNNNAIIENNMIKEDVNCSLFSINDESFINNNNNINNLNANENYRKAINLDISHCYNNVSFNNDLSIINKNSNCDIVTSKKKVNSINILLDSAIKNNNNINNNNNMFLSLNNNINNTNIKEFNCTNNKEHKDVSLLKTKDNKNVSLTLGTTQNQTYINNNLLTTINNNNNNNNTYISKRVEYSSDVKNIKKQLINYCNTAGGISNNNNNNSNNLIQENHYAINAYDQLVESSKFDLINETSNNNNNNNKNKNKNKNEYNIIDKILSNFNDFTNYIILKNKSYGNNSINNFYYQADNILNNQLTKRKDRKSLEKKIFINLRKLEMESNPYIYYQKDYDSLNYIERIDLKSVNSNYKTNKIFPVDVSIELGVSHIYIDDNPNIDIQNNNFIKTYEIPVNIEISLNSLIESYNNDSNNISNCLPFYYKKYIVLFNSNCINIDLISQVFKIFDCKINDSDLIWSNIFDNFDNYDSDIIIDKHFNNNNNNNIFKLFSKGWINKNALNDMIINNLINNFNNTNNVIINNFNEFVRYLNKIIINSSHDCNYNMYEILFITDDNIFENNVNDLNNNNTNDEYLYLTELAKTISNNKAKYFKSINLNTITLISNNNNNNNISNFNHCFTISQISSLFLGNNYSVTNINELLNNINIVIDSANQTTILNSKLTIEGNKDISLFLDVMNYPYEKKDHNNIEIFVGNLLLSEKKQINIISKIVLTSKHLSSFEMPLFKCYMEYNVTKEYKDKIININNNNNNNNLIRSKTDILNSSVSVVYNDCNSLKYKNKFLSYIKNENNKINESVCHNHKVYIRYYYSKVSELIENIIYTIKYDDYNNNNSIYFELIEQIKILTDIIKKDLLDNVINNILYNDNENDVNNINLFLKDDDIYNAFKDNLLNIVNNNNKSSNVVSLINDYLYDYSKNSLNYNEDIQSFNKRLFYSYLLFIINYCLLLNDLNNVENILVNKQSKDYYDLINIKDSLKYNKPLRIKDERFIDDCLI